MLVCEARLPDQYLVWSKLQLLRCADHAVLIEDTPEFSGEVDGIAMFDVAPLHHVDELAVAEKSERRR